MVVGCGQCLTLVCSQCRLIVGNFQYVDNVQQCYLIWLQVDANQWQHYQKLEGKLEAAKRDMLMLTKAFIDHRAQAAATTLVSHDNTPRPAAMLQLLLDLIISNHLLWVWLATAALLLPLLLLPLFFADHSLYAMAF